MPQRPNPEGPMYAPGVPLAQALAAQLAAALATLVFALLVPAAQDAGVMTLAVLQGVTAAGLAYGLRMDPWWLPIHALFVPGLVWVLDLRLPPVYALVGFGLLASVYGSALRTRVPLYLSGRTAARAVAQLLPADRDFSFIDLGSGVGSMLAHLSRARVHGRYYGIESAPVPYLLGRLRAWLGQRPWSLYWGDFRVHALGAYDVVYVYLSPAAMPALWEKARREMRSGSLLVSKDFPIAGVAPARRIAAGTASLYVWRM